MDIELVYPCWTNLLTLDRGVRSESDDTFTCFDSDEPPWECYGVNIRISAAIISKAVNPALEGYIRRSFLRPSPEPIIHSFWSKFRTLNIESRTLNKLASCLTLVNDPLRKSESYTTMDPNGVRYKYPQVEREILNNDLSLILSSNMTLCTKATAMYGCFILAHPLSDGNGRVARALAHCALAGDARYQSPNLPLEISFLIWKPLLLKSLRQLGTSGNWAELFRAFQYALLLGRYFRDLSVINSVEVYKSIETSFSNVYDDDDRSLTVPYYRLLALSGLFHDADQT